jgi:hypothetical protein
MARLCKAQGHEILSICGRGVIPVNSAPTDVGALTGPFAGLGAPRPQVIAGKRRDVAGRRLSPPGKARRGYPATGQKMPVAGPGLARRRTSPLDQQSTAARPTLRTHAKQHKP